MDNTTLLIVIVLIFCFSVAAGTVEVVGIRRLQPAPKSQRKISIEF